MPAQPSVVVFDVNETLSDMSPIADRFAEVGAPSHLAKWWFASLLRDGFATGLTDSQATFADLGSQGLRVCLAPERLDRDLDDAVEHIMAGFMGLPLHPDVAPGVVALSEAGLRLVTLTNGASAVAEQLLERGGLRDHFEMLLSVESVGVWKPGSAAYAYAARETGVDASELLLVAVHPWDIHGASRAGLATAWINRGGGSYPGYFDAPDHEIGALPELAARLSG